MYTSEQFQRLMTDSNGVCSMSRSGDIWDNAAMGQFPLIAQDQAHSGQPYRTRNGARAHVFEYIERFYNASQLLRLS